MSVYGMVAFLGSIVRLFFIPNPFATLEDGALVNFMVEPVLAACTFKVVGLFYKAKSCPPFGSFLYLVFYAVHTFLIMLWGRFGFGIMPTVIIALGYAAVLIKVKISTLWH